MSDFSRPDRAFTDDQVQEACGMSHADLRRLILWKAVRPSEGGKGRGKSRGWDMHEFRRISMIATLRNAGFSLKMANTLGYLRVADSLDAIWNPDTLAMNAGDKQGWFDPDRPRVVADEFDWQLEVINQRYVFWKFGTKDAVAAGELNPEGTIFRTHVPFHEYQNLTVARPDGRKTLAKWETGYPHAPHEIEPESLSWEYDANFQEGPALDAYSRPLSLLSTNLTLGLRIAVRRVLGMPVEYPS